MTPVEMAVACVQALSVPSVTGVVLVIPKGKTPKGFPRGEVLNEMTRNGVVERTCSYNAERVLKWLVAGKLIDMSVKDGRIEIVDLSGKTNNGGRAEP